MATVYAHTNDGYVLSQQTTWNAARTGASGTSASSTGTRATRAISATKDAVRGGGYAYRIYRSFFYFDTSGIDTTVSSATLKIYGYFTNVGDVIAVKATSDIETLGTGDFNAIAGWSLDAGVGDGGDQESNVTKYSAEKTTWTTSGYNSITLNAQARTDMENDDTLYIALLEYDHDLTANEPSDGFAACGLYYTNYTGTSRDPYIDYTAEVATTTDNAIFFGSNF